ncbi:hypothetical protein ACFL2M_00270 [Patescibacteria group bacterium]
MANQEIINYLKDQTGKGVSVADAKKALADIGWMPQDIEDALKEAGLGAAAPAMPDMPEMPGKSPDMPVDFAGPGVEPARPEQPAEDATPDAPAKPMQEPVDIFDMGEGPGADLPMTPGAASKESGKPKEPTAALGKGQKPVIKEGLSTTAKILLVGLVVVILAAVAGGALYAYYYFYQSPDRVAKNLIENVSSLKSVQFSADVALQAATDEMPVQSLQLTGAATGLDGLSPQKVQVNAAATMTEDDTTAAGTLGADIRSIEGVMYLKLTDIPGADTAGQGLLNDQWLEFSSAEMEGLFAPTSLLSQFATGEDQPFTGEEKNQIKDAFRKSSIISLDEKVGSEKVQGKRTTKYKFSLNKEGVTQFMSLVKPILTGRGMTDSGYSDLLSEVGAAELQSGEVWVGTWDYQLYQVRTVFAGTTGAGTAFTLTLWNHNAPIAIEQPEGAVPFAEALGEMIGSVFGGVSEVEEALEEGEAETAEETLPVAEEGLVEPEEEEPIEEPVDEVVEEDVEIEELTDEDLEDVDTDEDGLTDAEEEEYGTDPEDEDSDDDGYLDGEEVEGGYDPLGPGEL